MRGLSDTIGAIWINFLMVVASLPLVTVDAALATGLDAARRMREGQGAVTANYFRAFKTNFSKANHDLAGARPDPGRLGLLLDGSCS